MSSKKRKTRKEKEAPKQHNFKEPIYRVSESSREDTNKGEVVSKKAKGVEPWVIKDLKTVLALIGIMIAAVVILAAVVYKTNYFDFILGKLNIKY